MRITKLMSCRPRDLMKIIKNFEHANALTVVQSERHLQKLQFHSHAFKVLRLRDYGSCLHLVASQFIF